MSELKVPFLLFLLLIGVLLFAAWSSEPGNLERLIDRSREAEIGVSRESIPEGKYVKINNKEIEVDIADTAEERRVGLSKYKNLEEGKGMLFVFDEADVRTAFWMKGMSFPIDIVWINDERVAQITANVPVVGTGVSEEEIPFYAPDDPVDYVLEVGSGEVERLGIAVGDTVELPKLNGS